MVEAKIADSFSVDLKHALVWVARALDYVGIDDIHHNHRVAYIAHECAKRLNWPVQKQEFTFLSGLIHDCGVSQTNEHKNLISEIIPTHVQTHCSIGYHALNNCKLLTQFAPIILHHHTHWELLKDIELPSFEKDIAALVFISDRLDFLRAQYSKAESSDLVTLNKCEISNELTRRSGTLFRPEYVKVLNELVEKDGFWFAMEPENIESIPLQFTHLEWLQKNLSMQDLIQLGRFIAGIVDAKSPFTYQHSLKVAELCFYLAQGLNLPITTARMLYVSGLVHDIGKLRTPDDILHKPGKLTQEEYIHIKRHTIDTEIALQMVFPCSKIGEWASNHHEKLDGTGYPYNKTANELDLPSRIIAVADIFQALSQDRPYRGRLSAQEIVDIIKPMVDAGLLDQHVFQHLSEHLDRYYQISTSTNVEVPEL
ncbi:HD domain-containing protein [Vibrio sp. JPW-9-11-11]|uniref:HD-GYP domain-containing protein n=1 Tax=Vibrio sp. JPW-9-11-11 TaxID=1416532 RepID=UPI00159318D9|nr:HD domain-containing phosphohydrolase [Vibrio sp. JPW-9-11-11]NVD06808.1 HD domain-containing protein [Vibrio sp. JPW-9-11-11]